MFAISLFTRSETKRSEKGGEDGARNEAAAPSPLRRGALKRCVEIIPCASTPNMYIYINIYLYIIAYHYTYM